MAPVPKPPGQRRRRNAAQPGWRTLPTSAEFKRPPSLPTKRPTWLKGTRQWWAILWRSPMAGAYLEVDVSALIRLARLKEDESRGTLTATARVAMLALEDRFGLSPKSRRALQWEIEQLPREEALAPVRRLRVVDPRG